MPFEKRVTLPGSERPALPASQKVSPVPPNEPVRVTVVLARKNNSAEGRIGLTGRVVSRLDFPSELGADPQSIGEVERFAHHSGLTVIESSETKRRVILGGPAAAMTQAFGAKVGCYRPDGDNGPSFRARSGELTIPEELADSVIAVLGLDNRPVARAHLRVRPRQSSDLSYTPPQVAALYNFPKGSTGSGETIGIIELGGGYSSTDLQTYFSQLGIHEPSVTAVSVDGATNTPGSDADGEVMLDIEVAGAIAPGAKIAVYFTPNTDQGFLDAITDAVHDPTRKPSVISISWGGSEDSWTQQSKTAMNAALQDAATLGVTVTVAAGDNGSSDGANDGKLHVDFPASSPYVLACGGTKLNGTGSRISSEVVWNETASQEGATGGGVSTAFPLPSYQSSAHVPEQPQTKFAGRGVPDVAGNADPTTGYQVLVSGQSQVIGGTSAVAPLWAGLIALLNQQLGAPVGFLNPKLYALHSGFHDIRTGNNDDSGLGYYSAKAGWDPCTGLGSPDGAALLSALTASTSTSA